MANEEQLQKSLHEVQEQLTDVQEQLTEVLNQQGKADWRDWIRAPWPLVIAAVTLVAYVSVRLEAIETDLEKQDRVDRALVPLQRQLNEYLVRLQKVETRVFKME